MIEVCVRHRQYGGAFSWRHRFTEADKTIFNVVACYNRFEADFAHFLDHASDVDRFAKFCEWFTGFHVQYLKSSGALGTYYPDFVVVQKIDDRVIFWIVETKGQEDVEVASTDAQMTRWCEEVSAETGQTWRYLKVPYGLYYLRRSSSFASLVIGLIGMDAQLALPDSNDLRPESTPKA